MDTNQFDESNKVDDITVAPAAVDGQSIVTLFDHCRTLFEPLEPIRSQAKAVIPPSEFDSTLYPKGWLVKKKRKLMNVDVVESMRRITIQEMNRKDREIDGLNEQLDEEVRCLEHLQLQLLPERSKHTEVEWKNFALQD